MATADERRKIRESWAGTIAILRWVLPMLGGAAWAIMMYHELRELGEIVRFRGGTDTLASLFAHPVLLFLDTPPGSTFRSWGVQLLVGYYALLTAFLWNAARGRGRFWSAAGLYGLHAALNFIGCLLYTHFFPHIPGTGQYYLWGDLRKLLELGREVPFMLFTFGALLLAWHMFAWWRLWLGHLSAGGAGESGEGRRP